MKTRLIAGICIVVVLVTFQILMASAFTLAWGDFVGFYAAGRIAAAGELADLHDEALQRRVEAPWLPAGRDAVFFVRLQAWAAALLPFGLLPFRVSFVVWLVTQGLILAGGWIWAARRFGMDAAVLAAMFPPAIFSVAFGQDAVFWFGFVLLSWVLFERGRELPAGLCLGLCIIKPQLIFIVPVALVVQRRWRMLAGFVSGCVVMVGGSIALGGWQALPRYTAFVQRVGFLWLRPEREMGVSAILISAGLPLSLRFVLMAVALAAVVLACRRAGWDTGLAAAMLASFLIAPHTECYDTTSLVVAGWLLVFRSTTKTVRALAVALFTPIPWLVQLLDRPWTGVPALLLFGVLMALAWERLRVPAAGRMPAA